MIGPADLARGAADEADALRRATRLLEAAAQSGLDITGLDSIAQRIATLACQSAPYLATLLTRDPARWVRVAADPYLRREKPRDILVAEVRARAAPATTLAELQAALRAVRADELVRLGVRELELGLDTEVGRELARLADACFDQAIAFCDGALRARYGPPQYIDDDGVRRDARLTVIGMGKLGGEELNFSSDVDVLYVYPSDHGEAGALSLHEYFAKLGTQVTAALSQVTEDDTVFRVDLRLRPEGTRGAIASSLASTERYYETFGRPWERQAWIKARVSAGDVALGEEVLRTLRPFVFPRLISATVIDDVRALNRRIKRELVRPRAGARPGAPPLARGIDLKNGEGGIREIEFFVQALQLIHAGKQPSLRQRGTRAALDALLFAGLITDDEHDALWRAYRWLRHTEHVLQLEGGLQTQIVPDDAARRRVLAHRLGYPTPDAFAAELAHHTAAVSRLFATLGDPADEDADVSAILRGELADAEETEALTRLGFADPVAARAELVRARRSSASPLTPTAAASERAARIGAAFLAEIAASADPLAVCGELTAIAEACLGQALAIVEAQLAARHGRPRGDARLAVLGLGKLGGRELGYAADLDVIFVYSAAGDDDGESDGAAPLPTIEWFSRCAQRLLNALRQRTPRGRLYEIDTRLRPSGSQGLLVTSLAGWRRYHADTARLWERQALIKLRPIAGDRALGAHVAQLAADTVYGAPVADARAIGDAILQMRERMERELGSPRGTASRDLKVGAGGVIDIEFAAQYLQLVHGHAHPALQTSSTQAALDAAALAGVAAPGDLALLAQGYRFLRAIEHRLRVVHDQPIQRLPEARDELDKLARRSGFPDGAVLLAHVAHWRSEIRASYLRVLHA